MDIFNPGRDDGRSEAENIDEHIKLAFARRVMIDEIVMVILSSATSDHITPSAAQVLAEDIFDSLTKDRS